MVSSLVLSVTLDKFPITQDLWSLTLGLKFDVTLIRSSTSSDESPWEQSTTNDSFQPDDIALLSLNLCGEAKSGTLQMANLPQRDETGPLAGVGQGHSKTQPSA